MHGSLRLLVLLCWGATLATLGTATVLEKSLGTPYIQTTIYEAWWFTGLWILSALLSAFYIIQSRLYRHPAFFLHVAFAIILLGAFTTRLTALHGEIHLAEGVPTNTFTSGAQSHTLPYTITLTRFEVAYYLGTAAPADFIAHVAIVEPELACDSGTVSMNRILSRRGYRFYQHGIDEDLRGCTLLVAHDPWGIAITYCGYGLLLLGMLLFMGTDKGFRERIQLFAKHPTVLAIPLLIALVGTVGIAHTPLIQTIGLAMLPHSPTSAFWKRPLQANKPAALQLAPPLPRRSPGRWPHNSGLYTCTTQTVYAPCRPWPTNSRSSSPGDSATEG